MEKRTHRQPRRTNIKVFLISLAALAASGVTFFEAPYLKRVYESGRHRLSQLMRLDSVVWEEVGATNLSPRVSKETLWQATGLRLGEEMLPLDLVELEKKILNVPWIESVQLQKKLPSTLLVRYTVHHARALAVKKGKMWLISTGGKWIAPLGREALIDLPVLAREETFPLELEWLDVLEKELNSSLVQVHEVRFSAAIDPDEKARGSILIELQYPSRTHKLSIVAMGKPRAESLTRLKRVVQYLIKNNILVSAIDLRAGKKVVVNVGKRP